MSRRLGHQPGLDGVRALAILAVMGLHAVDRLFRGGFWGVDMFFTLSAFLITTLVLQETHDRRGAYGFASFYARRALRLGPALLLWLCLLAVPTAIALDQTDLILVSTAVSLFYLGDFAAAGAISLSDAHAHVWSLAIEEQFYIVWPAVLVWAARNFDGRRRLEILAYTTAAAAMVQLAAGHLVHGNYFLPPGHLIPLVCGCLLAHVYAYASAKRLTSALTSPSVAAAALAVLVVMVCSYRPAGASLDAAYSLVVVAATSALILHAVTDRPSLTRRLLSSTPAVWLGRRSYGLYLYHRTLSILIPGVRLTIAGPLVLLMSLAAAEASFRLVERPILDYGRARLATPSSGLWRARFGSSS